MDSLVIQVRLKGRVLQTVSFQGDVLRIGRMKENDIVINNLSVSRFHALLRRENGQVVLEDSGSENGCHVNGTRISGSVVLQPGDEVLVGKHLLVLSEGSAQDAPPPPGEARGANDAWDASNTYFVGVETQAKMLEDAGTEPAAVVDLDEEDLFPADDSESGAATAPGKEIERVADEAESPSAPVAEPIEVTGEGLEEPAPSASDAAGEGELFEETGSEPELGPVSGNSPFEFGMEEDLAGPEASAEVKVDPRDYDVGPIEEEEPVVGTAEPATPETQSPEEAVWYAGLIIQNEGKLERVISWDEDRLTAGRSHECEILLDQPEISRRHAIFVRDGDRYEVRDLESINGILVNGEKISRRSLEVGDTVKIEGFELTFLLDRSPIASEIKTAERTTAAVAEGESPFNMTMIDENLPIGSAITSPSVGQEPPAPVEEAEAGTCEEGLFEPDDAGEKDLVDAEAMSASPLELEDPVVPAVIGDVLTFELKVRVEDLPEPLRKALADVDGRDLRLPVEIAIKTDA